MLEKSITCKWLKSDTPALQEVYEINHLKKFLFDQWCERAKERGLPPPVDTSSACKFISLFVKIQLGGAITGNSRHQFNVLNGKIFDLCADNQDVATMIEPYEIEKGFIGNKEHLDSMRSCLVRVLQWKEQYYADSIRFTL